MYSKNIENFKSYDIKLLRSMDDIWEDYTGEGLGNEYMYDCNIEQGEVCQLTKTPTNYSVGNFNKSGCGTSYYSIDKERKFIEGVDFEFV